MKTIISLSAKSVSAGDDVTAKVVAALKALRITALPVKGKALGPNTLIGDGQSFKAKYFTVKGFPLAIGVSTSKPGISVVPGVTSGNGHSYQECLNRLTAYLTTYHGIAFQMLGPYPPSHIGTLPSAYPSVYVQAWIIYVGGTSQCGFIFQLV